MRCRGIRGATTVDGNTRESILSATKELLSEVVRVNEVNVEDVACIFFTTTADLNAEFPALGARELGFTRVPLLCGREIDVPGSLPMCLRILVLFNTEKSLDEVVHVYLGDAQVLRPDVLGNGAAAEE